MDNLDMEFPPERMKMILECQERMKAFGLETLNEDVLSRGWPDSALMVIRRLVGQRDAARLVAEAPVKPLEPTGTYPIVLEFGECRDAAKLLELLREAGVSDVRLSCVGQQVPLALVLRISELIGWTSNTKLDHYREMLPDATIFGVTRIEWPKQKSETVYFGNSTTAVVCEAGVHVGQGVISPDDMERLIEAYRKVHGGES